MIPTARTIPPAQPSARQDALYPERGPSNSLYLPLGEWPRLPSTARIERGPCDSPPSPEGVGRLFFTARIERPPLYRGGSASKKNGLPAPSHHSEAARCASTNDGLIAPSLSHTLPETGVLAALHCARRGSTASSCGLREQEEWRGPPLTLFPPLC